MSATEQAEHWRGVIAKLGTKADKLDGEAKALRAERRQAAVAFEMGEADGSLDKINKRIAAIEIRRQDIVAAIEDAGESLAKAQAVERREMAVADVAGARGLLAKLGEADAELEAALDAAGSALMNKILCERDLMAALSAARVIDAYDQMSFGDLRDRLPQAIKAVSPQLAAALGVDPFVGALALAGSSRKFAHMVERLAQKLLPEEGDEE